MRNRQRQRIEGDCEALNPAERGENRKPLCAVAQAALSIFGASDHPPLAQGRIVKAAISAAQCKERKYDDLRRD